MVFGGKASGFASPAQGYEEQRIDLNRLLVTNPSATYFFRLDSGDMERLGLPRGALLVVDRSKIPDYLLKKRNTQKKYGQNPDDKYKPADGQIVIIRYGGEFLCRLMTQKNGRIVFTNGISDIVPSADTMTDSIEIIGTVTASVNFLDHQARHPVNYPQINNHSVNYDFSY